MSASSPGWQYVIVRSDLPVGFAMAQAVHAASAFGPVPEATNAVVLAVSSEAAVLAVAAQLSAAGVDHRVIREPDAPWDGQATAIGVAMQPARLRALSALPLFGRSPRCRDCADVGGICYVCNGGLRRREAVGT